MGIETIVYAIVTVASTAYQVKKQKDAEKKQKAAEEKRKGFLITTSGDAAPLPIVYGKNLLGGQEVGHKVTDSFIGSSLSSNRDFRQDFSKSSRTGTKNEYLHIQYALCQDGIQGVQWVKVNGQDYNDTEQGFKHWIRTYNDGGVAETISTSNGFRSTNKFKDTAWASATFQLNRDDYNYNGIPTMQFLVKGRRVRTVSASYTLSSSYVYSNNPAWCLLDYLLNDDFGRGLSTSEVDLQSFYEAAQVCDTTVVSNRSIGGGIHRGTTTRDIPLYECNLTLGSDSTVRDNIERIMSTMGLAELTWSSEGKYKLLVEYPTSTAQTEALVDSAHYFTDDDIIREEVTISWTSATERLNQATVSFLNEHEDFKEDSITWPTTNSSAHNTYLNEDNGQPFRTNQALDGVTDPYHAKATAEQMVRQARDTRNLSVTVSKKGLSLEPGDFINITSDVVNLTNEVFRVASIQVNSDLTVELTCYSFAHTTLAWNVNDNIAYAVKPRFDWKVDTPTALTYTTGTSDSDPTSFASLSWTNPVSGASSTVVSYKSADSPNYKKLIETTADEIPLYPRGDWSAGEVITFSVQAKSPLGRLSNRVTCNGTVNVSPSAVSSVTVSEELYDTNTAAGVKARANITWTTPSGGVTPNRYKVEYYRDAVSSTYRTVGFASDTSFEFNDVKAGAAHFRITPISPYNEAGTPTVKTATILGLSTIPVDPSGFSGKVSADSIKLTWDKPVDLDVLSGGYTQIRYTRDDTVSPSWGTSQVLVKRVGGSTTSTTVPISKGYFLIKHFDSSGNASAGYDQFLSTLDNVGYNVISTITEDPTFPGTKTNCTVVSSELTLDVGTTSMTYLLNGSIDLGSAMEVRLTPNLTASLTSRSGITTVADYPLISDVDVFSGETLDSALTFEVRRTDDDPAGAPTWTDWEVFTNDTYKNRAFEFRLVVAVDNPDTKVAVSYLSVTADKVVISKRGTSASATGADVTVTFDEAFYATPVVQFSTVGGAAGDSVNIVSTSTTGFSFSVYNAGARVARTINWTAFGQ